MPISSSATSGRCRSADSSARLPLAALKTSWPPSSRTVARVCSASTLSSATSMRRRTGAGSPVAADRPLAADAETDAPSPLGVFGRVAQDVAQGLREPQRVGVDPERRIGNLGRELVPALLYQGLHDLDGARDQRRKLDRLARQVDLAARDARHIEQVVDQARQVRELPLDHVARPAQLWVGYRLHAHE